MNIMKANSFDHLTIDFINKKDANEAVILDLYQVVKEGFDEEEPPWTVNHIRHTIEANNSIILVATLAKEKIGFIIASETPDELDIYMVVVSEKYKRKNIGTYLFNDLIEYAKNKKIDSIVLETRISNTPAIALYERVGFEKVGERKAYYSRPIEDAVVMKHELGKER